MSGLAQVTLKLSRLLFLAALSFSRYWPRLTGLTPNSFLTVVVYLPLKLPSFLTLRTIFHFSPFLMLSV